MLHYHVTERQDSPFWRACRGMDIPEAHHPAADLMGDAELADFLGGIKSYVEKTVAQLPSHQAYVEQYCRAAPESSPGA